MEISYFSEYFRERCSEGDNIFDPSKDEVATGRNNLQIQNLLKDFCR